MKNKYEVRGDVIAIFVKYKGETFETLIDADDIEEADSFPNTWGIQVDRNGTKYVVGKITIGFKNRKGVMLHRWLFNIPADRIIDHINHEGLDNRRSTNLREATYSQNNQNKKGARSDSLTGIRGVMWDEKQNRWIAKVTVDGKTYLKRFKNKENAIKYVKKTRSEKMPFSKESGKLLSDMPDELPVNNSSGYRGVSWNNASQKWKATVKFKRKKYHLGYFTKPQNAYEAVLKKKQELVSEERKGA